MKNLTIFNSKQLKQIKQLLKSQFDAVFDFSQYATLISPKNKIYIANKDIFTKIDLEKLKINSIGMYFAHIKNNELRLSLDGSQLVGPIAKKNIIEIDDKELKQWIQGIDLDKNISSADNNFIIIKHNNDYIGCGKIMQNKILNFVPKTRRIKVK